MISNDLEIVRLLRNSNVELITCGGTVQKSTGSIYGYYAIHMLEHMKFDIGFFGTSAIDEKLNMMTPTSDKAFLKKQIVGQCQQSFLVADKSKFNRRALTYVNSVTDYTYVVTDYKFNEEEKAILKNGETKILSLINIEKMK
ncbi:DeoR/GlpR transcriptional regulator [Clostridium sp. DL-VIII]|uniref:DeoR/GlpR transcriptional regulator n=1 Tax=Clostridium sp. DL-VIII TaxID=641107 RepID=UPI0003175F23|nr:DeoR/GlpR transcriptional regulator [Clostridium sp. DL-VIII]